MILVLLFILNICKICIPQIQMILVLSSIVLKHQLSFFPYIGYICFIETGAE